MNKDIPLQILQQVPNGAYCYTRQGKSKINCPFWSINENYTYQNNGYCSFLDLGDWMRDKRNEWINKKNNEIYHMGLLWDQVKACGINDKFRSKINLPNLSDLTRFPIKAITVSQPFASLIAEGKKIVENRTWNTNYRGKIAIHAGKGLQYLNKKELKEYPYGGIIAIANLVTCVNLNMLKNNDKSNLKKVLNCGLKKEDIIDHEYTKGPWCWVLKDINPCVIEYCKGSLGIWTFKNNL